MKTEEGSKESKEAPRIRSGMIVRNGSGKVMTVIAANQQKRIACCVYEDLYGRRVEEYWSLSELMPV